MKALAIILTSAIIALPVIASVTTRPVQSVPVEFCVTMSNQDQTTLNFLAWMDDTIARQRAAGLTTGNVLNINALDHLDPVHHRATSSSAAEQDYDGDGGREYQDHLRDNGAGRLSTTVAGTFVQIGDALPVIEAPSIVTEHPADVPVKSKSEG